MTRIRRLVVDGHLFPGPLVRGFTEASGPSRTRFIARWMGWILAMTGLTGLVSALFPHARSANTALAVVAIVLSLLAAGALVGGLLDRIDARAFPFVLAVLIAIAALGVYAGGSPSSGTEFFLIWASPVAFAFFTTRQAVGELVWIAVAYAVVLAVGHDVHRQIGPPAALARDWVIVVATALAIGVLMRRFSRQVRDDDRRFEFAFSGSPIGAGFLGLDLVWLEVNDCLCDFLDTERDSLVGSSLQRHSYPEDGGLTESVLGEIGDETARFRARFLLADGRRVWGSISATKVVPEIGDPYIFCQIVDVTEFMEAREALANQAGRDPLTGLINRALLFDRLQSALRTRPMRGELAIAMIDLDRFNVVNDSLGHQAGDEVLAALAPRLLAALEPGDTLARFGGDEFVLLCEGLRSPIDAVDRAARLAAALREPVTLASGESHVLTASIGVTVAMASDRRPDALIRDADIAMYRAKAAGRNRIELFNHPMHRLALARLKVEGELRQAIDRGELDVWYQPVVEIDTGEPVLVEALCRWHHPDKGTLAAGEFIPIAEETGLVNELGDFVLSRALADLAELQRRQPNDPQLQMSVNVSGRQLAVEGFPEIVAERLRRTPITPGSLFVEITESVLLESELPAAALASLKALGLRIMLDDFGTGYSSLAYLKNLPVDQLKIDKSFVLHMHRDPNDALIVRSVIELGHNLGLHVVAEGIEHVETWIQLTTLGCDSGQGYLLARPMPAEELSGWIREKAGFPIGNIAA